MGAVNLLGDVSQLSLPQLEEKGVGMDAGIAWEEALHSALMPITPQASMGSLADSECVCVCVCVLIRICFSNSTKSLFILITLFTFPVVFVYLLLKNGVSPPHSPVQLVLGGWWCAPRHLGPNEAPCAVP